jgi:serine phosphatase RsbU (regulator of sigma subunit)
MVNDSTGGEVAGVSYKDSRQLLWFGYHSGAIARFDGSNFEVVVPGVEINSAITGITELAEGELLISTLNNGLFVLNPNSGKAIATEGIQQGMFTSLYVKGNTLILGSQEGLSLYSIDNTGKQATSQVNIAELELLRIQDIQPSSASNAYWIATEDQGVFLLVINGEQYTLNKTGTNFLTGNENIQAVYEDPDKNLWISTLRNGVLKLSEPDGKGNFIRNTVYNRLNGLPGDAVKKVFRDIEGNIWIASYGKGLSLLSAQPMVFQEFANTGLDNDVLAIAVYNDLYFMGGQGGLFRYKKGDKAPVKITNVPEGKITALKIDDHTLFIGTETNGLYYMDVNAAKASKVSYEAYSMGNWISAIAISKKNIFLGTKDGIYQLGRDFKEQAHYTTTNGMPHNNIEHIILDSQNRLLIATRANGIYRLTPDGQISNLFQTGNNEVEFKSIAEDQHGGIWAATYGDGVVYFAEDSVYQFTVPAGLKSDYCYSIIEGNNGSIWVGHRLGMSRINSGNMHISLYDQHIGITGDCNLNAVNPDKNGVIYFGTTSGLIIYDPSQDINKPLPPFTNIVSVLISDKPYNSDKDIVLPYKLYRLRIEFIGLNYSDPQAVRYQYKLEGYDLDWSDVTSQTFASYPRIEDGEYTFLLRAYNSEGLSQEVPVSLKIKVKPPIWKTWWFIALSVLAMALAFYIIVKWRERKQKQLQEYLETELVARTKEVVEQKEEIEIKNRDITDSINYAKRIQTSMLPPIRRLQHHFSGSFVFYSPRDIVSGDFYWFDQVNDNKFTIVCADSTGHGVPGAFMSMIGSTLIKDICTREAGNSPSSVLQVLDCELRNTLNQNLDDGTKPGDGMDIIVCEIDLKTHYVRYASAMRPLIIYRNGEEVFIKGSRNSVGGHYEREDNLFMDEGLQLSKGDIIYMFSDGYSDQFGGPMGKKFKMVRLKNLLQDIHSKPMDEQCLHVKNTFHLWKENYEQVDDVLFMGIKI